MTELQKCEYEILKRTIEIINENGLDYFLVCGSALGAVKYNGFIPWDDDVDIALPRPDYEKFLEIMKDFDEEGLSLQNYRFDPNVPFFFSKMRSGKTTYIEKTVADFKINHGVYIDVFPLDGYPNGKTEAFIFKIKRNFYYRVISMAFERENRIKSILFSPLKAIVKPNIAALVKSYEKAVSKYDISGSELLCNFGNSPFMNECSPKWHYGNGIMMKFEDIDVRVPEKFDEYLTLKYGNWRADLPESEKKGHHYYKICDLEKPYTYYTEK
ncbi:MAG: LicD family protein [Oscillospiraceae bacterium]|nr:LicD family protein [Oscillospiraceae bacterium]